MFKLNMFRRGEVKEEAEGDEKFEKLREEIIEVKPEEFESYEDKAKIIYSGDIRNIFDDFSRGNTANSQLEHADSAIKEAEKAVSDGKQLIVVENEKGVKYTYVVDVASEN